MSVRKGDIVELRIDRTGFGGPGVARLEGLVVFVRGAVRGDMVKIRIFMKKRAYAEARILEILEPSADRVKAPCPYSGLCGGCQWQHVRYECQMEYKRSHVEEAMAHIGNMAGIPVREVIPSPRLLAYRNKMEFSFSERPWLPPEEMGIPHVGEGLALGLHVPGYYHKVLDLDACLLQDEGGNEILRAVKRLTRESGIPAYGLKSHQGFWRFLTLRHSTAFNKWMVNMITSEERLEPVRAVAESLSDEFHHVSTVVNNINTRKASVAAGEKEIVLAGEGGLQDRIGPFLFHVSANSFFQTNSLGAERLYEVVADSAELKGSELVLDLYSGTGTIPILLSSRAGSVIGMEIEASAVRDAERNCKANGIENCRFILGDIRESIGSLRTRPDVLIIDPPRAGMHKQALSGVMALGTDKIVYVSCNPATLARDIGMMREKYDVVEIQPVDMFPHTYHIEAVAKLVRQ